MKRVLLCLSVLLITLISASTVNAQAVKFHVKEPPILSEAYVPDGANIVFEVCAAGTLYGCGNAKVVKAYLEAEGLASTLCYNGGNDPGPIPGQTNVSFKSDEQTFPATNGHAAFDLCAVLKGSCKGGGKNWHNEVSNVVITKLTLWVNGVAVDLTPYLN